MSDPRAAPTGAFVVAFVVGVTPGKWARVWGERMPRHPLSLEPVSDDSAALSALSDGSADVALLRLPIDGSEFSSIPLYTEQAVVVAPRDHPLHALDSVTLGDLIGETVLDGTWRDAVELIAANAGVAVMPQSVARALSRRDVISRALTDGPTTQVALAWLTTATTDLVDEFIGIVRGRTANSSRGKPADPTPDRASEKRTVKQTARPPRRPTQKKRGR